MNFSATQILREINEVQNYRGTEFSNLEIFAIATTYFMLKYAKDQIQRSRFGNSEMGKLDFT